MKKIASAFLVIAFLLVFNNAEAQKSTKQFSLGIGLEAGLVTGDAKETYNFSPGITVRGSYKAGPGYATLTTGAIVYIPKSIDGEDLKAGLRIPIKAGYKYIIKDPFFVMGEVGFSTFKNYFEDGEGKLASISQSGFTYAPAVGIQTGKLELSLRYEATSLKGATLSGAFLRLGFNF